MRMTWSALGRTAPTVGFATPIASLINRTGNFLPSRFLGGYGRPWNISEGVGRGMRSRQDGPSRRPLPRPRAGGSDLAAAVGLTAGIVPPSRGWTGRFGERTGSCHQAPALARADQNNPPP